jgi:hypothetical protein
MNKNSIGQVYPQSSNYISVARKTRASGLA